MVGKRGEYNEAQKIDEESKPSGVWGEKKAAERGWKFLREDIKAKRYGGLYHGNRK